MITLRMETQQEVAELSRALRSRRRALERITHALRDPVAATRLVTVTRLIDRFEKETGHAQDH